MSTATKTTRTRTTNRARSTRDPKTGRTTVERTVPRVVHRPPTGGKGTATGQSLPARAPGLIARGTWTHRWRLAPAAGAVVVAAGQSTAPLLTLAGLTVTGAGLEWAARTKVKIRGRMYLSARERRIAGIWCGAAGGWTAVTIVLPEIGWRADAVLLAAALGWPTWAWVSARNSAKAKLSAAAAALLTGWVDKVAGQDGPAQLRDSRPVRSTVVEPAVGAVAFQVQLAGTVHGQTACNAAVRRQIEVLLKLPVAVVTLGSVRDDATRIQVSLSPDRHLENAAVAWPGPVLNDDGTVPIAATPDGAQIDIRIWNDTGVEHGLITGTSDAGKSSTSAAAVLPGIAERRKVVLWVDGKRGTSVPYLRKAFDRYATSPKQWMAAIEIAYKVMVARQIRRGEADLSEWTTLTESDPILTLWIDEATAVNAAITSRHVRWVCEIAEHGRALGVNLVQVSQSPRADKVIGGVPVRDLMAGNGFVIAHRPGGSNANRLTQDSTSFPVDLKALPPEPGFAAILRKGAVLAPIARVRFATKDAVKAFVDDLGEIRHLEGADAEAAGDLYTTGWGTTAAATGTPTPPVSHTEPSVEEVQAAEELESRTWVLDQLRAHGPMQLGQLADLAAPAQDDGPRRGPSRKTISNALNDLATRGLLTKDGRIYTLVDDETEGDEAESDDQE
jgi:hypothetical protein